MAASATTDKHEIAYLQALKLTPQQVADAINGDGAYVGAASVGMNFDEAVEWLVSQSFNSKLGTFGNVG